MNRLFKLIILIAIIIFVDQVTKGLIQANYYLGESTKIIDGLFSITYVRNPGAAFGMGASATSWTRVIFLLGIPVIACFWLMGLIFINRNKSLILGTAYSLILAGAVGNLIDRFTLSYVVDFLDFYWRDSHFPAFNIADSAISIAAGLLIYDYLLSLKSNPSQDKKESDSSSI
jgi:signal peptidase II